MAAKGEEPAPVEEDATELRFGKGMRETNRFYGYICVCLTM